MTTTAKLYWNDNGRYSAAANRLRDLVPFSGSVPQPRKNPKLEKFRRAVNCYYDLYNNGLCNRGDEFRRVIGVTPSHFRMWRGGDLTPAFFVAVENAMDQIVRDAAEEQGLGGMIRDADFAAMDCRVRELTQAVMLAHNALDVAKTVMNESRDRDFVIRAFEKTEAALRAG